MGNIYKKLLEVKKRVPYIQKNKKGHNYNYASPSDVLGALNPILNELGLILKTEVVKYKTERVYLKPKMVDLYKNGVKEQEQIDVYETMFTITTKMTWVDSETGEKDENMFMSAGINGDEKGLGSALTYNERYFMLKFFNIATDEDDPDVFQTKHMSKEEIAEKEKKNTSILIGMIQSATSVKELSELKKTNPTYYSISDVTSAAKTRYSEITSSAKPITDLSPNENQVSTENIIKKNNEFQEQEKPTLELLIDEGVKDKDDFIQSLEKGDPIETPEEIGNITNNSTESDDPNTEIIDFLSPTKEESVLDSNYHKIDEFVDSLELIEWFKGIIGDLESNPDVSEEDILEFKKACSNRNSFLKSQENV